MVKTRLAAEDAQTHGWLLDGYPRSAEQAEAIEAENIRPDIFILINVSVLRLHTAGLRLRAPQAFSCCCASFAQRHRDR